MNLKTQEIYSEVYSVLDMLGESYISKLPVSLFDLIKKEKKQDYNPKYDLQTSLSKQNIKRESLSMIALFHLKYWCMSDEEKEGLKALFKDNEEKHQAEIREKYNPDNVFNNVKRENKKQEENVINTEIIEVKEDGIIKKIINKIKKLLFKKEE